MHIHTQSDGKVAREMSKWAPHHNETIQQGQSDERVARALYQTEHATTKRAIRHAQSDERAARKAMFEFDQVLRESESSAQNVKNWKHWKTIYSPGFNHFLVEVSKSTAPATK